MQVVTEGEGRALECVEPATGRSLGRVRIVEPAEVRSRIARARAAQPALASLDFAGRRRLLTCILEAVLDRKEEIVDLVCTVSGKTRENALAGEIWPVAEKLRWTIAEGERHLRPERVSSGMLLHKRARIDYVPRGVVGAIVPWNYPFQNPMNPTVTALMAGNAVVVKPSEWVAAASAPIEKLLHGCLEACGLPKDLVQVVDGVGDTGRALVEGGVDVVLFIGSVPNGRRVLEASVKNLVPVVLELGGKDPLVVCDDAHLDQAVHAALNGTFINCGQNCVASERILVEDAIAEAFEGRVGGAVRAFRQGPPLDGKLVDVGGMITPLQLELVERLVQKAVSQGARVVAGGKRNTRERGQFFEPTVLADVTPDMDIYREEVFGPVMLLTRFKGDDAAVKLANDSRFGLSASVFSQNRDRARRIASRLESGMVAINDFGGMTYMAQDLPFGGVKESGFGRMNGRDGLRAYTHPRAVLDDRLPLSFPATMFPVADGDFAKTAGVVDVMYRPTLGGKLSALARLITGGRS